MSRQKITVAEYLTQQIAICNKSQREIAETLHYEKANVITMFKQGTTKLPINKVPLMAEVLGVDKIHLLRICMSEYMENVWAVIESMLGDQLLTKGERRILEVIREASDGRDVFPQTQEDAEKLKELASSWADRVDHEYVMAVERNERLKEARAREAARKGKN